MPYLNLDPDYFDHPKTKRLIGLLGKGSEVLPIKLWAYCAKYHPATSILEGYSKQEIESIMGWDGEKGKLVEILLKIKFLEIVDENYVCHDWKEHEGHIIAFKKRSSKANKARWGKLNSRSNKHPSRTPKDTPKESPSLTIPYHTIPNQKEREDKEKEKAPVQAAIPQTLDEVKATFTDPLEAEKFWNYYTSIGWRVGRNPMKSWRAAARVWQLKNKNGVPSQASGPDAKTQALSEKLRRLTSTASPLPTL